MNVIYIVTSNFFTTGVFGVYSSVKRARVAFEDYLTNNADIVSFEDDNDYGYQFTTERGEIFGAEICVGYVDHEFETGYIEEEE